MPLAAAAPILIPAAIKGGTALWGGLQARNAQNDAVSALLKSFGQAGDTATTAVDKVNPQILGAADKWGGAVMDAGNAAADSATAAADKGIAGVNDAIAGVNGAVSAGQGQMQPYTAAGTSALDTLSKLLNKPQSYQYQADPGYQFRLAEGQKQITRMAAAHGAAGGGGTAKALAQYNSGLASQEYNTGWNRWNTEKQARQGGLTTLAGMGERAGEFSGDLGLRGAAFGLQGQQFNARLGTDAAEYGGSMRTGSTQWAGSQNINAVDKTSQNSLSLANFLANLQINSGRTIAAGDIAKSDVWSKLIPELGQIGSDVLTGVGKKNKWKGW